MTVKLKSLYRASNFTTHRVICANSYFDKFLAINKQNSVIVLLLILHKREGEKNNYQSEKH